MTVQFYRLRRGDTLGELAHRSGTTVAELCRINGIENPDKIAAGEVIALKATAVCKVRVLLIDWDRNPIPDAKVRLAYSGKRKILTSRRNGCLPEIITRGPEDLVDISIMRLDRTWKKIAQVASGWGNKLVTLRSPKIRLMAETGSHPQGAVGKTPAKGSVVNKVPPRTPRPTIAEGKPQADYGDGRGPKARQVRNGDGFTLSKLTNDQAELEFLKDYVGGELGQKDYEEAAAELKCDVMLIKAVAKVESSGKSGFDNKKRPIILYERHIFSKHTCHKYDETNSDISSTKTYRMSKKGIKVSRDDLEVEYYATSSDQNYQRLAKAYFLDKDAAVMACSWGKFQILGENYKGCGYSSLASFLADQVKSEKGQLHAFVQFIKMKKLQAALKEKDWAEIARRYNGQNYKKYKYDQRIKQAYESLCKE